MIRRKVMSDLFIKLGIIFFSSIGVLLVVLKAISFFKDLAKRSKYTKKRG